jgi:hypothetical protein
MIAPSLGKGIALLPLGSSSCSLSQVRDTEVMKFFIMPQSLSLGLMGYAWFGQASVSSLSKWFVGGYVWRLALWATIMMHPTRAVRFLIVIVIVSHDRNPLRAPFLPLLAALGVLLEIGRGSTTSLLVAYWAALLSSSSLVYLKTPLSALKGSCCYTSCMPLSNAFSSGPLGSQQFPFWSLCPP